MTVFIPRAVETQLTSFHTIIVIREVRFLEMFNVDAIFARDVLNFAIKRRSGDFLTDHFESGSSK
jgi:hypothetical protein